MGRRFEESAVPVAVGDDRVEDLERSAPGEEDPEVAPLRSHPASGCVADSPSGNMTFWAGAGPAIIFRDFDDEGRRGRRDDDDGETDFGANLLAGVGMVRGPVRPYGQVKVILSDETEAVLAFGVRF